MPYIVKTLVLCSCAIGGPRTTAFLLSVSPPAAWLGRSARPLMMTGSTSPDVRIQKDVVIIGGGLAGLSTALELAKRGRQVTVVSRNRAEAAAEAAGGMIAPQAERLESGPYLDLCLSSRAMYAEWVRSIEAIAGSGGGKQLEKSTGAGGESAAQTHFWSSGGFMSPAFQGDAVHTWNPPPEGGQAHWIDKDQALEMEPSMSRDIVGAWWYPQDMSIDAQRMFRVLEQACSKGGVEILQGMAAASLVYDDKGSSVDAVVLEDGRQFFANAVVSCTGAWMRELLPVPMVPHKGQMMSLREPDGGRGAGAPKQGGGIGLTRVFFAEGCYIIPKRDGRIVVGSTVEVGEYGLHNTPAGIKQIIDAAVKVCPALADLAVERTWAGLRPVTPDTFPVLGASQRCPNLFVAGGYWRNGVLLAPKTAQLVADAVCGCLSSEDDNFLQEFSMDRFTSSGAPAVAAVAAARPSPSSAMKTGIETGTGMAAEGFISEASPSEILEMERAALEGVNDGGMLSALEGMFGKGVVQVERAGRAVNKEQEESAYTPAPEVKGAVNEYHASEEFSEQKLKDARMANRLVQEGSDARLEAMFGDDLSEEEGEGEGGEGLPDGFGQVNSWEDGAAEVANMIGAELVEMEVDIPEGMTIEEALGQQGPVMKVLWESPYGEDIDVPRGMNIASMMEAGLIAPFDREVDGGEGLPAGVEGAGARPEKPASGVFDPTAVKGAKERSTEVSELYAKVMANKAKAKDKAAGSPTATQNGYNGSGVKGKDEINGSNAWLSGVLGHGQGLGVGSKSREKPAVQKSTAKSGHEHIRGGTTADVAGMGGRVAAGAGEGLGNGDAEVGEEMVGYDFILKDKGDKEGKVAQNARASIRSAPEGGEAWENYENIANEAIAMMEEMEAVEYLPP